MEFVDGSMDELTATECLEGWIQLGGVIENADKHIKLVRPLLEGGGNDSIPDDLLGELSDEEGDFPRLHGNASVHEQGGTPPPSPLLAGSTAMGGHGAADTRYWGGGHRRTNAPEFDATFADIPFTSVRAWET